MHIGITGASGFLGAQVIGAARSLGYELTGFSRRPDRTIPGCQAVRSFAPDMDLTGIDAVLHLAGESILGLWTKEKQSKIIRSRIDGTRWVVNAIERAKIKPSTLVSASGASIYGNRTEEILTESSATVSSDFLAEVGTAWENEGSKAEAAGVRFVPIRIALVLGKGGGAMSLIDPIFRFGLGGKLGHGQQWMSWIHIADVAGLFLHVLRNASVSGPLNGAAPNPVRNEEFTKILGEVLRRPTFFVAPEFVLRTFLRGQSSLVLDSQRIIPEKALKTGYEFRFPDLRSALTDVLAHPLRKSP